RAGSPAASPACCAVCRRVRTWPRLVRCADGYLGCMAEPDSSTSPTTLSGVLDAYVEAGYGGSFTTVEGARLECHACGQTVDAAAVTMSSLRRLEGASDP